MGNREIYRVGGPSEERVGYSRAVKANGFIFVSGTSGWDPQTQSIAPDAATQMEASFQRLDETLAHFGASLADLVQLQIVLADISEWQQVVDIAGPHIKLSNCALLVLEGRMPSESFRLEISGTALAPA